MTAFKRLSVGPTVPDLLRRDADRRAAQSCRTLPLGAWCRTAVIAAARNHQLNGPRCELEPTAASDWQVTSARLTASLAPVRAGARGLKAQRPMQARSNAIIWSGRAALRDGLPGDARRSWQCQAGMAACFAGASFILAAAQLLNWWRLLSPDGISTALKGADRLTRAGMRLWRAGRASRRT